MARTSITAAIILLLALNSGWAAEDGYRHLLADPTGKTAELNAEITKNFNAAVRLLEQAGENTNAEEKRKRFEEARIALEKVLSMKPEAALARELRNRVKEQVITLVFLEAPQQTLDTLKAFLRVAEAGRREWLRDHDRIGRLIVDLTAGEFDKMWVSIHKLRGAGQHAVPQLFEKLKTADRDTRTTISMALIASGEPVVLPLGQALKMDDDNIKQEVIFILGQIGDARALPPLAAVARGYNNPAVKNDAREAIEKIVGGAPLKSAEVYYLDQADAYYKKRFDVLQRAADDYVIWGWEPEDHKIVGRKVPEYAFYLEMAEKLCYEAITLNEHFDDAYSLLLCIYYQQLHTYNNLLAAAEKSQDVLTKAEVASLGARRARIVEILRTATAIGKQNVYGALNLALSDGNVAVAVSCADTLRQLGSSADLPVIAVGSKRRESAEVIAAGDPLVAALESKNKLVRYHAAAALAAFGDRDFKGMKKVIPILSDALGERGVRVVMVADSDIQVINQLKGDLKDDGYIVDIAHDPRDALNVAYAVPMKDALIIDASFRKTIDTFLVDFRSSNVPIILLTTEANANEAKAVYQDKVNGFVSKPVKMAELKSVLFTAFIDVEENAGKSLALGMNYLAAKTLANVDVNTTVLPMKDAVAALVAALELPDEVRLEAMKALGNIAPGGETAGLGLITVAANTGNSLGARIAALETLTAIAIKHGGTTKSVTDLSEKLLLDEDPTIRSAAGRLIGSATYSASPVRRLIDNPGWVTQPAEKE